MINKKSLFYTIYDSTRHTANKKFTDVTMLHTIITQLHNGSDCGARTLIL